MTRDAAQAARLLGIDLLDHVIVGQGRFVSLKEQVLLQRLPGTYTKRIR